MDLVAHTFDKWNGERIPIGKESNASRMTMAKAGVWWPIKCSCVPLSDGSFKYFFYLLD